MKKVLIIRNGSLGDLILTLPVFQTFRKNGYKITVAGRRDYVEFLKKLNCIDSFLPLDGTIFLELFSPEIKIDIDFLKGFDFILSYTHQNEIFSKNLKKIADCRKIVFHPIQNDKLNMHITDYLISPIKKFFSEIETVPYIQINNKNEEYFLIHPGSGSKYKNWPVENFLTVFRHFSKNNKVLILLGEGEENQIHFWKRNVAIEDLIILPNFDKLIEIFQNTRIYLGNDSGITHLAGAFGIKTFAIFGPTSPLIWGPRGKIVKIIFKQVGCNPCIEEKRKYCEKRKCLEEIIPEEVIEKIDQ